MQPIRRHPLYYSSARACVLGMSGLAMASMATGCSVPNPLYCEDSSQCTDPERPYCDIPGEYAASKGLNNYCIPDPDPLRNKPSADAQTSGADSDADALASGTDTAEGAGAHTDVGDSPLGSDGGIDTAEDAQTDLRDSSLGSDGGVDAAEVYGLTVSTTGGGKGSVRSNPGDIDCGTTCVHAFSQETHVSLEATPDGASEFLGWAGACTGTDPKECSFDVHAATSVTAEFGPLYRLDVEVKGNGVMTVRSADGTIDCGETCSALYRPGTSVTLDAIGGAGVTFQGWSGGGCTGNSSCAVPMTAATTITATNSGLNNLVFVTKNTYKPGSLGSVAGGHAICNSEAAAAGLSGTFVAWLSDRATDAVALLDGAQGWRRVDGLPFADTPEGLVKGVIYAPVAIDPFGNPVHDIVFTGTLNSGLRESTNSDPPFCDDWQSVSATGYVGGGQSEGTRGSWSHLSGWLCGTEWRMYCFQLDYANELEIAPALGRTAFVSEGYWGPGEGIADADRVCREEAAVAGLDGSYRALLGTDGASAASRFDENRPTWVRPDGLAVARSAGALLDGNWLVPLNVTAAGRYLSIVSVWTGSTKLRASRNASYFPDTCSDWTSSSADAQGLSTRGSMLWSYSATSAEKDACSAKLHLYCLQE